HPCNRMRAGLDEASPHISSTKKYELYLVDDLAVSGGGLEGHFEADHPTKRPAKASHRMFSNRQCNGAGHPNPGVGFDQHSVWMRLDPQHSCSAHDSSPRALRCLQQSLIELKARNGGRDKWQLENGPTWLRH